MNDLTRSDVLTDSEEIGTNGSADPSFDPVLQARLSRRSILRLADHDAVGGSRY